MVTMSPLSSKSSRSSGIAVISFDLSSVLTCPKHISIELIGTSTIIRIPNPNYIVFYNGDTERNEDYELKLSDAFMHEDKSGRFEWTARVLNVNKDYNLSLQKKCKPLYDYIRFVSRINENKNKGMSIEESVDEAVDWACELNLLEGYIREQKAEVRMNLLTEYDEEAYVRIWLRDGRMQQAVENAKTMLADNLFLKKFLIILASHLNK